MTKAAVAAGTAGTIATAYWLLNRIFHNDGYKRIKVANEILYSDDGNDEMNSDASFLMLPVVSESDESINDSIGYTDECFPPHHDICMLSVCIETVDPFLSPISLSDDRVCLAPSETESTTFPSKKRRALSFTERDGQCRQTVIFGADGDVKEWKNSLQSSWTTSQRLYVRL